jgi:hypothetical protein
MTGRVAHGRPFMFCFAPLALEILFTRNFSDNRLTGHSVRCEASRLTCNCTPQNPPIQNLRTIFANLDQPAADFALERSRTTHLRRDHQKLCRTRNVDAGKVDPAERREPRAFAIRRKLEPNFAHCCRTTRNVTVSPMRILRLRPAAHLHLTS